MLTVLNLLLDLVCFFGALLVAASVLGFLVAEWRDE